MSYPKLMNPCKFLIWPQSFNDTNYDHSLKEPIGEMIFNEPIIISGQIKLTEYYTYGISTKATHSGREDDEAGYILFRYIDSNKLGWHPRSGDKISHFYVDTPQEVEKNVFITQIRPAVHIRNVPSMFRAYYTDKTPALQKTTNVRFEDY